MERLTGTVLDYRRTEGFGEIQPDVPNGEDFTVHVTVHMTVLEKAGLEALEPGQRVSYVRHDYKFPRRRLTDVCADEIQLVK